MREIKAIIQPFMVDAVLRALEEVPNLPGATVSQVLGWGRSREADAETTVLEAGHAFARKSKLEIVVTDDLAPLVMDTIARAAHTGSAGDGKIFVYDVSEVVRIRTGERGKEAL